MTGHGGGVKLPRWRRINEQWNWSNGVAILFAAILLVQASEIHRYFICPMKLRPVMSCTFFI